MQPPPLYPPALTPPHTAHTHTPTHTRTHTRTQLYLGGFADELPAARAHDVAALRCRGADACLNFGAASAAYGPLGALLPRLSIVRACVVGVGRVLQGCVYDGACERASARASTSERVFPIQTRRPGHDDIDRSRRSQHAQESMCN